MTDSVTIIHNSEFGRRSQINKLKERLSEEPVDVTIVSAKSDSDMKVDLRTGTDIEFLIRIMVLTFLDEIPEGDVLHAWRIVTLFPFVVTRSNSKLVATCAGEITVEMRENKSSSLVLAYNTIERITIKYIDVIIAVNHGTRRYLQEKHGGIGTDLRVIPVGVDQTRFYTYSDDHKSGNNILFVGRITKIKNIPLLIDAFSKLTDKRPECELTIVGDGDKVEEMTSRVKNYGIEDSVNYIGEVKHNQVPKLMNDADCLVLTSKSEGSPNVVRESICCGTPVVSTPVGDVPQLLQASQAGIIAEPDPYDIACAISQVLTEVSKYSKSARDYSPELSYEKSFQEMMKIYNQC